MAQDIYFRAFDKTRKKMIDVQGFIWVLDKVEFVFWQEYCPQLSDFRNHRVNMELMQFTGMVDKEGRQIFEADILSIEGIIKGNMYENNELLSEKTNILIPCITFSSWQEVCLEAIKRGCRYVI